MTQKSCAVEMRNAKPGNHLNIIDVRKRIVFQRVHRLGKPRRSGDRRPIIARFLCYQDREEVIQKAQRSKSEGQGLYGF